MASPKIVKLNILAFLVLISFLASYTQRGQEVRKAVMRVDYFSTRNSRNDTGISNNASQINLSKKNATTYANATQHQHKSNYSQTNNTNISQPANGSQSAINLNSPKPKTKNTNTKTKKAIESKNFKEKIATQADTKTNVVKKEMQMAHPMYSCKNGTDCFKLNELLKAWNTSKPKAAACILTSNSDRNVLKVTLDHLNKNFVSFYDYPIIIFHEKEFQGLPEYRKIIKDRIFFQEIELKSVDFLNPIIPPKSTCPWSNTLAYRNMCRFQAKTIFELPIMQNLDYYMRLDAHSYILKKVPIDIFAHMKSNKLTYGYPCVWRDDDRCMVNLRGATDFYIKAKNIQPHFYEKMAPINIFFNNLQVGDLNFFRGPSYQNYIKYIDTLGGIYYHRWGDAPIVSIAVSLFIPLNQTRQFYDIHYKHRREVLTKGETYTGPRDWTCPPI